LLAAAGAPTLSPVEAIAAMVGVTVAVIHEFPIALPLSAASIHVQVTEATTKSALTSSYDITKETLTKKKDLREF
jgi:hypothetical protein